MYTISVVIFLATTLGRSNAQYGVSDVVVQVIVSNFVFQGDFRMKHRSLIGHCQGITFNLIIVRVNGARGPVSSVLQSTVLPQSGNTYPLRDMSSGGSRAQSKNGVFTDMNSEIDVDASIENKRATPSNPVYPSVRGEV